MTPLMAPGVNPRAKRDDAGTVRVAARGALMRPLQCPVGAPFMAPWVNVRAGRDDAIYGARVNPRAKRDDAGAVRAAARGALMRPLHCPVGAPFMAPGVNVRAGRDDAIYGALG